MQLMEASDNQVPVSITLEQAQQIADMIKQGVPVPNKTLHDKALLMQYGIMSNALLDNRSVIFALDPVLKVPRDIVDSRLTPEQSTGST